MLDLYSRLEVQRYIGRVPRLMQTRAEALARIAGWRDLAQPPHPAHPLHEVWAIELGETGQPVGTLLLKSIPASRPAHAPDAVPEPSGDTEIGWHLHPDHWRKGYAVEAATAVLAHALASGLERAVAVTNPANLASQRVCTRIGMTHLGRSDAYYDLDCELFEIRA